MQDIDGIGDKYEVDQDKCVEGGLCAKECHAVSIINTEEDYSVPLHDLIVRKADVVVCGGDTGSDWVGIALRPRCKSIVRSRCAQRRPAATAPTPWTAF